MNRPAPCLLGGLQCCLRGLRYCMNQVWHNQLLLQDWRVRDHSFSPRDPWDVPEVCHCHAAPVLQSCPYIVCCRHSSLALSTGSVHTHACWLLVKPYSATLASCSHPSQVISCPLAVTICCCPSQVLLARHAGHASSSRTLYSHDWAQRMAL